MGYHILKAEEIREPKTRGLAEVRAEIIAEIRKEKGKNEANKAASADREKALSGTPLPQLAKDFDAARDRHHYIEQRDIEIGLARGPQRGLPVVDERYAMAEARKFLLKDDPEVLLVLGDEQVDG